MRSRRQLSTAKLKLWDLRNLRTLYEAGYSCRDLARAGWRKWGYASPLTAERAISEGFKQEGWQVRTYAEAHENIAKTRGYTRDARGRFIKKGS